MSFCSLKSSATSLFAHRTFFVFLDDFSITCCFSESNDDDCTDSSESDDSGFEVSSESSSEYGDLKMLDSSESDDSGFEVSSESDDSDCAASSESGDLKMLP